MRNIDSYINVDGHQLYVRFIEKDENQPTLVFLHDSLGCVTLWRDFPCQLAAATAFNLLIYDRKGYGQSEPLQTTYRSNQYLEEAADGLHSLLQQLHITKAILFGHSDGGSIALIAAAKYPLVIKAVIAEAAHIFVEPETLQGIKAAVKTYQETNLKNRLAKYHGEKTETVFRVWTETWLSDAFRSWNIEHFLPKIICPTLIIQGEKDEYGTIKQVERIVHATTGKSTPIILPALSHTPHKEAPETVLQHAMDFIKRIHL